MSEHEEEQSSIRVKDKRKFNLDGSVREGYEEENPPSQATRPAPPPPRPETPADLEAEVEPDAAGGAEKAEDIPGADDPASFVNFLSTLATNAAVSLGIMAHPATGKPQPDLDGAKYWIDILGMLREKTKGNLHPQEAKLIDGLLADFRMQYVELMRAYEAKLKKQAAGKIGLNDLLGKK
jgi:hypothetical protein